MARRPASVTETIGARTKEAIQAVRLVNLLSRLARGNPEKGVLSGTVGSLSA